MQLARRHAQARKKNAVRAFKKKKNHMLQVFRGTTDRIGKYFCKLLLDQIAAQSGPVTMTALVGNL